MDNAPTPCSEKPCIELFPSEAHDGISPTVRLTWCVSRAAVDRMAAEKVSDPHLLLVSTQKVGDRVIERGRKVVPLSDGGVYPEFYGPGDYTLLPIIVWDKPMAFMKRHVDGYAADVIFEDGTLIRDENKILGAPLDVSVPKELFGRVPPKWVRTWANLWHEAGPRDQCAFRRRCIVAFSIQPIVIVLWLFFTTIFRTIAATFLTFAIGTRGVQWSPILHPWRDDATDVWFKISNVLTDSIFWSDSDGDARLLPLASLTPIFGIAAYFSATIWAAPGTALVVALCFMAAPVAFILIVGLLFGGVSALWHFVPRNEKDRYDSKDLKSLEPVICNGSESKRRRPVRLWFADIKAKICKPYAHAIFED